MRDLRKFLFRRVVVSLVLSFCSVCLAQSDQAAFEQSLSAYRARDFVKSRTILTSLIKKNPTNSIYWFNLGNVYYMESKYDVALRIFKKVVDLKSGLSPAALLYGAKCSVGLGRKAEAKSTLESLLQGPLPPNLKFQTQQDLARLSEQSDDQNELQESALRAYQSGDYQKAVELLRSLKDQSDPDVVLLEGLALNKLGRSKEARQLFLQSARMASNSDSGRNAERLADQLTTRVLSENPYWLFIDLAAGFDSNVFLEGASLSPVSSSILKASLGFGARLFNSGLYSGRIGYLMNRDDVAKYGELRITTHTVQLPILYTSGATSGSAGLFYQTQTWDQSPALTRTGLRAKANQTWSGVELGVETEVASQKSPSSDYSFLNGTTDHSRAYAALFGEILYFQIGYEFGSDRTGDLNYTDGLLPLANRFAGPTFRLIWKRSAAWIFSLSGSQQSRIYTNDSQPASRARRDQELSSSLRISRVLSAQAQAYFEADQTRISSTLGPTDIADKNVSDVRALVGISWDVL